jgi:hypothetical protein
MTPLIVQSGLTGQWYVLTRYTVKKKANGDEFVVASIKHDVTDQMKKILQQNTDRFRDRVALPKKRRTP